MGNEAHEGGGFSNTAGSAELTNVTISGNVADEGGGIYTGLSGATLRLAHVTAARNTAEGAEATGGGINSRASNVNLDHTLIVGSPAIDASEPAEAEEDEECSDASFETLLEEDQRGAPRPVDGDGSGTAFCDAGAFEFVPPDSLMLTPADATNDIGTQHTVTATVTDTREAPSESISVRFSVSVANSDSGSAVTDANGEVGLPTRAATPVTTPSARTPTPTVTRPRTMTSPPTPPPRPGWSRRSPARRPVCGVTTAS